MKWPVIVIITSKIVKHNPLFMIHKRRHDWNPSSFRVNTSDLCFVTGQLAIVLQVHPVFGAQQTLQLSSLTFDVEIMTMIWYLFIVDLNSCSKKEIHASDQWQHTHVVCGWDLMICVWYIGLHFDAQTVNIRNTNVESPSRTTFAGLTWRCNKQNAVQRQFQGPNPKRRPLSVAEELVFHWRSVVMREFDQRT
jgi:hypothetical protein